MPFTVPHFSVLGSGKLTCCYHGMQVVAAAFLIVYFFATGQHLKEISLVYSSSMNLWVNQPSDALLNSSLLASMAHVCGSPRDYDYWREGAESDPRARYDRAVCTDVEANCDRTTGCLRTDQLFVALPPTHILIGTFLRFTQRLPSGEYIDQGRYYVPQAEAFSVSFGYDFTVPGWQPFPSSGHVTLPPQQDQQFYTSSQVYTAFLDPQREVIRVVEPGGALTLPVPELLSMAGLPEVLTEPSPDWGRNVFPDATYPEGPIGLVGGLEIELFVHCHKKPKKKLGPEHKHWNGPTCYVIATARLVWTQLDVADTLSFDEGQLRQSRNGILVVGKIDGTWEYWDPNNTYLNFTALLILMQAPKWIAETIALKCLGHQSKLYSKVGNQPANIQRQIAGMTARVISYQSSFRELQTADATGGVTRSGWRAHMESMIGRSLGQVSVRRDDDAGQDPPRSSHSKKEADAADLHRAADFVFDCIRTPPKPAPSRLEKLLRGTRLGQLIDEVSIHLNGTPHFSEREDCNPVDAGKGAGPGGEERITVDDFLTATVSHEPMGFADLMWFFDKDRRESFFERLCTPQALRRHSCAEHNATVTNKVEFSRRQSVEAMTRTRTEQERALQGDAGDMVDDVKVSNRQLLGAYLKTNRGVVDELAKTHKRLAEDIPRVREAHARLRASVAQELGHELGSEAGVINVEFHEADAGLQKAYLDAETEFSRHTSPQEPLAHAEAPSMVGEGCGAAAGLAPRDADPRHGPRGAARAGRAAVHHAPRSLLQSLETAPAGSLEVLSHEMPQAEVLSREMQQVLAMERKVQVLLDELEAADRQQSQPSPDLYARLKRHVTQLDAATDRMGAHLDCRTERCVAYL